MRKSLAVCMLTVGMGCAPDAPPILRACHRVPVPGHQEATACTEVTGASHERVGMRFLTMARGCYAGHLRASAKVQGTAHLERSDAHRYSIESELPFDLERCLIDKVHSMEAAPEQFTIDLRFAVEG